LPWQPILGAKSAAIGDTPSFLGLEFHNGRRDGRADERVNSVKILSTLYNKNSSGDEIANVNFYAVRREATRIRRNNAK